MFECEKKTSKDLIVSGVFLAVYTNFINEAPE